MACRERLLEKEPTWQALIWRFFFVLFLQGCWILGKTAPTKPKVRIKRQWFTFDTWFCEWALHHPGLTLKMVWIIASVSAPTSRQPPSLPQPADFLKLLWDFINNFRHLDFMCILDMVLMKSCVQIHGHENIYHYLSPASRLDQEIPERGLVWCASNKNFNIFYMFLLIHNAWWCVEHPHCIGTSSHELLSETHKLPKSLSACLTENLLFTDKVAECVPGILLLTPTHCCRSMARQNMQPPIF